MSDYNLVCPHCLREFGLTLLTCREPYENPDAVHTMTPPGPVPERGPAPESVLARCVVALEHIAARGALDTLGGMAVQDVLEILRREIAMPAAEKRR